MRKITGNCYNQVIVKDDGNVQADVSSVTNRVRNPMIFRVLTGWYNTREDVLRLLNGVCSGPSTTLGTDLNLNRHVWIQGGVRVKQTIRNPCSYPIHVTIWKHSLKCDDAGQTKGVYVEGTLPFAVGSAQDASNLPQNEWWDFFDQSSRQGMGTAADNAYMKFYADEQLTINSTGGYPAGGSPFFAGNVWERGSGFTSSMDFRENVKITWLFPELRRKLRTRIVFKGWIPAMSSRTYTYSASMPSELRPRDYISADCPNFSKYSYFLTCRAYAPMCMDSSAIGAQGISTSLPYAFYRPPAALSFAEQRVYRLRRSGDSIPSFGSVDGFVGAAVQGWLGPNWGLQAFSTYKAAPEAFQHTSGDPSTILYPIVPSFRSVQFPKLGPNPVVPMAGTTQTTTK